MGLLSVAGIVALALTGANSTLLVRSPSPEETLERALVQVLLHHELDAPLVTSSEHRDALGAVLAKCGSDGLCLRDAMLGSALSFGCVVDLVDGSASITLLDARRGFLGATAVPLGSDPAEALSRALTTLLAQAEVPPVARLVLWITPGDAALEWREGGERIALEPGANKTFRGPAGRYRFALRAPGFDATEREVVLITGHTTEEAVELRPEGGFWSSPWPWVILGSVVLSGAGVAMWAALPTEHCGCIEIQPGACAACD